MLIKNESFRNLYKSFIVIENNEFAKMLNKSIQEIDIKVEKLSFEKEDKKTNAIEVSDNLNAIFAFAYVDHTMGLSFVLLSTGHIDDNDVTILKREDLSNLHIFRKSDVMDSEFEYLENLSVNNDFDLEYYKDFIDVFNESQENETVETLRSIDILDNSREPDYPDDVKVEFIKEGFKIEDMWVRYESIDEEGLIEGVLLNVPFQDLGIDAGDKVKIFPYRPNENEDWILICDLNK